MELYKLSGQVSEGTFPNERVVVIEDHAGHEFALVVQESRVEESGDKGTVVVKVLDRKGDFALVRLPGELITSGRTLSVRDAQLEQV